MVLRFVEVKSIKVRNCEDVGNLVIRPEDNLTKSKWSKLKIAISSYLVARNVSHETRYQVDLASVYIDTEKRQGRVKLLENVLVE